MPLIRFRPRTCLSSRVRVPIVFAVRMQFKTCMGDSNKHSCPQRYHAHENRRFIYVNNIAIKFDI